MLYLVLLTDEAASDEVADELGRLGAIEGGTQPGERLLDPLMTSVVCVVEQLWPERGRCRHVDAALVQHEAVGLGPCRIGDAIPDLLALGNDLWEGLRLSPERVEEGELRPRHELGVDPHAKFVLIAPRQGVGRHVLLPKFVLHLKTIPK